MIVIARRSGRLGNRLFSFAHYIANSLEHGNYTILCPVLQEYASFFASWNAAALCSFPASSPLPRCLPGFLRKAAATIANGTVYGVANPIRRDRIAILSSPWHETIDLHHPENYPWQTNDYLSFVKRKIVLTNGWVFWDHKNFIRHAESIRQYFRLADPYEKKVQEHVHKARGESGVLVGIHIRRGDYKTHCDGKYYFQWEDYRQLLQRIQDLFGEKTTFLLCSDEAVPEEHFGSFSYALGPGSAVEDMYALAQCDYIIGPPSSFSGWASFMGKAPLYYMEDIRQAASHLQRSDFIPMTSFDYQNEANNYRWAGE